MSDDLDDVTVTDPEVAAQLTPVDGPWVIAGRYEIRGLLGAGGMGNVYKAFDRELEDSIALKLIKRELLARPEITDRFRQEVKLARRVTHRNVARVFDLGEADGVRFLTMELIEGVSLGSRLAAGPLSSEEVRWIGEELCAGLAAAHAAGVVHRDLKPDNIILSADGRVVITDFGIARTLHGPSLVATARGAIVGTPVYMAPEAIARQAPAGTAADIFSLGVILFELLTGELPWRGESDMLISAARLHVDALDPRELVPDIPDPLAAVVLRCLARDPRARYASVPEVGEALQCALPKGRAPAPSLAPERPWSAADAPRALGSAGREVKTVAVLPLRSREPIGDGHVCLGLQEAIIDALSSASSLCVRPRGMSSLLDDSNSDPTSAGQVLDAQVVIEGTLARAGDTLTVAMRAWSAADRVRIWSRAISGDVGELFRVAEDIARGVADALSAARPPGAPGDGRDPAVTDLFLRARQAYHSFWQAGAARAVGLFEQALQLAPSDPLLLSGYALASVRRSFFTGEGVDVAERAALAAAAVAPDSPEVKLALASLCLQRADPVGAVRYVRAALERAPSLAEASWLLGRVMVEANVLEPAVERLSWTLRLEPQQHLVRLDLSRGLALLGRWDEVDALVRSAPMGHEAGNWLERARFAMWRREVETAARCLANMPADATGPIALARELFDTIATGHSPFERPAFGAFLTGAQGTPRREAFAAQISCEVWLLLGDEGRASAVLARAIAAGLSDLAWLERCTLLEPLRARPDFEQARIAAGTVAAAVRDAIYGA
ncbi:MAG: protein kinase [Polyangiaceae bacterium]|nr:protein kinase [Polyangiaceae bacterium]